MARLLASLNGVIVSGSVTPGTRKRVAWGDLPQGWMAHFGGEEIQLPPGRWEIDVTQITGTDDFAIVHWPGESLPVSIATAPPVGTTVGYTATMRSAMMRRIITTGRVIVRVDATAVRDFVMHARMLPPPLILAGVLVLWDTLSGGWYESSDQPNGQSPDRGHVYDGGCRVGSVAAGIAHVSGDICPDISRQSLRPGGKVPGGGDDKRFNRDPDFDKISDLRDRVIELVHPRRRIRMVDADWPGIHVLPSGGVELRSPDLGTASSLTTKGGGRRG